jgi:ArsR family transcriptional regulator
MIVNTAPVIEAASVTDLTGCCSPLRRDVLDPSEAALLADAFKALGDPVRLQLLNLIATAEGGEACACDLVEPVGRSQPTVSHHLRVLRQAGLVASERRGTWVWYRAEAAQLEALRRALAAR